MIPNELLNIAYNQLIEIEPTSVMPEITLSQGIYGPFFPLQITHVPLFVALTLKKSNMCRIRAPSFFLELDQIIKNESESEEYTEIFPYFFEFGKISHHFYNINSDKAKIKIAEVRMLRYKKTHAGLQNLDGKALNLNCITVFEFNEIKAFILPVMKKYRALNEQEK